MFQQQEVASCKNFSPLALALHSNIEWITGQMLASRAKKLIVIKRGHFTDLKSSVQCFLRT